MQSEELKGESSCIQCFITGRPRTTQIFKEILKIEIKKESDIN